MRPSSQFISIPCCCVNIHRYSSFDSNSSSRSIVHGLQDATAHARLIHDGPNVADPPKDWPVWAKFIFAFFSGFAPILWVAAFLAFISWRPLGEAPSNVYNLILGIALLIVIVVSSMFTFYQVKHTLFLTQAYLVLT